MASATFLIAAATSARPLFNIEDFGAKRGGRVLCTRAIRSAVAAACVAGGGLVVVPNGTFLTGSFSLSTSVYLHLEPLAVLRASNEATAYPAAGWDWDPALVDTYNTTDTGILGEGRIDGQALPLWIDHYDPRRGWVPQTWQGVNGCVGECRPKLVRFTDCRDVRVEGVMLENSPDWNLLFRRTSNVQVRHLRIVGDHQWPNNDGIDVESGENISINNVSIDVGDDGICLSSGSTNPLRKPWVGHPAAPVYNVSIANSWIRSKSSAIKLSAIHFGQLADHGDIHAVSVSNVSIVNSSRGIGFQQRSGSGSIYDLTFDSVSIRTLYPTGTNWWGSGEPIWLTSVAESANDSLAGSIRNVLFRNVSALGDNGVLLSGGAAEPMQDIRFEDSTILVGVVGNTSCAKGVAGVAPSGCRDYRPRVPDDTAVEYGNTSVVRLEGRGSVHFSGTTLGFSGGPQPWWLSERAGGLCGVTRGGEWTLGGVDCTELPGLPSKWPMAGITFTGDRYCPNVTMGNPRALASLEHLASTGASHVALIVTQYQWSINTTDVFPLFNATEVPSQYYVYKTEQDADLRAAIDKAHALGLKVLLKPHVDPLTDNTPIGNTWRGDIGKHFDEAQWERWFESYGRMLLHYASMAERLDVAMLSMNCELITANLQAERWRALIKRTREVFSGLLTAAPNGHGHQLLVTWWDAVDVIGVDLYDFIAGDTVEQMVASWEPYLAQLHGMHLNYSRPVVLTEIGYCSGGCSRATRASAADLQQQANHYEALYRAAAEAVEAGWFLGAFWWNWDTDDAFGEGDTCLTPQHKPAEETLRIYYRATVPRPAVPSYAPLCVGMGRCTT